MIKIYFSLIVGIFCVSIAAILIKLANDVPSVIITAYRLSIASILLIFYAYFKGEKVFNITRKELILSLLSGLFLSFHFIFWIASIKYTSIPSSVTLVSTSPIFVGLFSYYVLKEKQSIIIVASIIVAITGSALISASDGGFMFDKLNEKYLFGDFLAILGAIAVAVYFMIGSYLRKDMSIIKYITLVYSFAAFFSLIFSFTLNESFIGYKTSSYLYMVLIAVFPQLVGHTSFNWALKHMKASSVSIATLGEPIGSTILAYIFFRETVGILQSVGMVMIFSAIVISSKNARK